MEIEPNYFYAWNDKGNALSNLNKYDEAIECYDKALEINPNFAVAHNNRNYVVGKKKKEKKKGWFR